MNDTRQLTLMKKGHTYLFRYEAGDEAELLRILIEQAQDANCPLDWFDAAVLSHQMGHRMAEEMQALLKGQFGLQDAVHKAADAT